MEIVDDESAQTGTILFIVVGLFILGLSYILYGAIMNQQQIANNALINNTNIPYTQERADSMTGIYDYFKYYPVYMLLIFIVWGIKRAIDKQSGVI